MQALTACVLSGLYCVNSSESSRKISLKSWLSFSSTAADIDFLRKLILNSLCAGGRRRES